MNSSLELNSDWSKQIFHWYDKIKAKDADAAEVIEKNLLKEEEIAKNRYFSSLFQIIELRKFVFVDPEGAYNRLKAIDTFEFSDLHNFFYHYFRALYFYTIKDYRQSVIVFNKAEQYLGSIDDRYEEAEFLYHMGSAYFQLDYNHFAIQHVSRALVIFKEDKDKYFRRWVSCSNLLGLSYADSNEFESAEKYYEESLSYCRTLGQLDAINMTLQNIGILKSRMGEPKKAIQYFEGSLKENSRADYVIPTLFLLSKEYLRYDEPVLGEKVLKKGLILCQNDSNEEYLWHFKLLDAIFIHRDRFESVIENGLGFFKTNVMWEYVREYALELADHFYETERFKKASIYYKIVAEADENKSLQGKGD